MKSPITGKEMQLVITKESLDFRKESFEYYHHGYRCEDSEEIFTTTELDNLNIGQVYNQYLVKYNIPFPEDIKAIRKKYELPANRMSLVLGFGVNTYRNYENGEVPSLANAKLIHLAQKPEQFKDLVNESTDVFNPQEKDDLISRIDSLIQKEAKNYFSYVEKYMLGNHTRDIYSGYKTPNLEKLGEMVVFFTERLKPFKTAMNKLLFYADFLNFRKSSFSISGLRYAAIDKGPVPDNFQTLFDHFDRNSIITVKHEEVAPGYWGEIFTPIPNRVFNSELFSEAELETLEQVCERFKNVTRAIDIVNLSHEEDGWIINYNDGKRLIEYDYAFKLKNI
ncbi:type II toxin-antitoxin system antitoxin SocA domain-containing protein [Flavobacterium sp. NRK1]|uniref:type II toxin-antitoxin system antitoxin SocA domain-containing protein n=1 Tax=Flavobacterium sp. NRK1 TaxID=2954929 RepID=UPI0020924386|nr:type II toxin-antitoxin system antitoxin SocA domain-containing protein [Flavobacterium sp. NRK1]MCO6147512.1 DUF4065 domain-containing protein [Flavobacterium sp. NRK1]